MSGPPHGELYNNHPHNVWAWEIMHRWWYEGQKRAIEVPARALEIAMKKEYSAECARRCIDHGILAQIATDAARPVYPSRDRAHPPPTEAPPTK